MSQATLAESEWETIKLLDSTESTLDDLDGENEYLRQINAELVQAMQELQGDLRESIEQRKAYEATIHKLNESLHLTDLKYWSAAKKTEDLQMKLQAVTFLENDTEDSADIDCPSESPRLSKTSESAKKKKRCSSGKAKKSSKSRESRKAKRNKANKDTSTPSIPSSSQRKSSTLQKTLRRHGKLTRAMITYDPEEEVPVFEWKRIPSTPRRTEHQNTREKVELDAEHHHKAKTPSASSSSSSYSKKKVKKMFDMDSNGLPTPTQAAFYHIIAERDTFARHMIWLKHELHQIQDERDKLQGLLQKYQALIEVSYDSSDTEPAVPSKVNTWDSIVRGNRSLTRNLSSRRRKCIPWLLRVKSIRMNGARGTASTQAVTDDDDDHEVNWLPHPPNNEESRCFEV